MPTQKAWAIKGKHGLYHGTSYSRAQAIAEHIADIYLGDWPAAARSGKRGCCLSQEQRKAWEKCRREGHHAVKVRIIYG